MRILLLLSLLLASMPGALAQAPATPAPPPQAKPPDPAKPQPAPAKPQTQAPPRTTAPARPAQPAGRSGMAITVTDMKGSTIPDVRVEAMGPTMRMGETNASGQINFPGMQAGTYRVRFTGDEVTAFEREVTVRAGQIADVDVTLTAAPPPKEAPAPVAAPPAPAPSAPAVGPAGQAQALSIIDLVERELVSGNQPRKDTLVACSGNTRSMLVQLNQPQAQRVYDSAEAMYYVIAGEGTATVGDRQVKLQAGGYVSLPRGTPHAFTRQGRRPLIMLAVLSGAPCEEAR